MPFTAGLCSACLTKHNNHPPAGSSSQGGDGGIVITNHCALLLSSLSLYLSAPACPVDTLWVLLLSINRAWYLTVVTIPPDAVYKQKSADFGLEV